LLLEEEIMKAKMVLLACVAAAGLAASSGSASAMPNGLAGLNTGTSAEHVRWVCNPWGRCWWRPNYYYGGPRFYGPRWGGGWRGGWRRGWRRW